MNNEELDALVTRLKELEDPQKEAVPSFADTDWRTLSGVVAREIESLRQQLAHREAQIVMLRGSLELIALDDCCTYPAPIAQEALAATDDLSGYILCEREPVGYIFQHEDTGRTMCVEAQQVEWNFEKNNPRLFKVGPLYRAWEPKEQGK